MDGWLKGLIATACVVVISGGVYLAWTEYQRSQQRELAKQASEHRAMTSFCKQMIRDLSRHETKDYKGGHLAACVNNGYVTEAEFRTAGAGAYFDQYKDLITPAKRP